MPWLLCGKGPSGFSSSSTAEEVTNGIDGHGLTAVITGASSGIGKETARVLALRGVHVVMAVRNLSAGRTAKEAISKEVPKAKIDVLELDLSSMAYNSVLAYGQSKLSNILHANELSRRFKEEGVNITANSLHPGVIVTNLFRYHSVLNAICSTLGRLVMKNVQQGAATTCYVALHPQVGDVSGKYFSHSNIAKPSSKAEDVELAKRLWDFSSGLTSV